MVIKKKETSIYISLSEASKSCNYSQEYLSLRARQGRLKSAKFGRNWVTTEEWLAEYIKKSEEYNSVHNGNGHRIRHAEEIKAPSLITTFPKDKSVDIEKIKIIKIPKNLPIEKEPKPRFRFAMALIIFLFIAGGIFSQKVFLKNSFKNISYLVAQEKNLGFDKINANINSGNFTADLQEKFKEYLKFLADSIELQFTDFKNRILSGLR